uniref:Tc1-like transposase DDE domain-containing protein n=1 Tax=Salmo trutta TaxID=8032 RepID=A0A674A4H6_SALTR
MAKYLSVFEWGMVVDARRTGLSVSRTATLLGFSRSTVSSVYQKWGRHKLCSATDQMTVQYNIGAQRPIKKCTSRRTLTRMGLLQWLAQSPNLNPIEHLWDEMERAIQSRDPLPANLTQLWEAFDAFDTF